MKYPFTTSVSLSRSVITMGLFGILVIVAIAVAIYFYVQYQKTQAQLQNPTQASEQETKMLIEQVGKLIELPTREQPTIATVSDISELKGQTFFVNAKNGDKVLIYAKAQKAILYDPVSQKVREVGPINMKPKAPLATPTPANLRVVLYNGTTTVGITSVVERELKTTQPTMVVIDKDNAKKSTYIKTIVVDITGKYASQSAALAQSVEGEVVSALPEGEVRPDNADLVVILGEK